LFFATINICKTFTFSDFGIFIFPFLGAKLKSPNREGRDLVNQTRLMGEITPGGAYIQIKNSFIPIMFSEGIEGRFVAIKGQLKSSFVLVNDYEFMDTALFYNDAFIDGRVCKKVGRNVLLETDGMDYISCVCRDDSLRVGDYVRFAGKMQGNKLMVELIEKGA